MSERKTKRPRPVPAPKSPPEQEEPQSTTFTEIGGSPAPGLTLRHVLRGHTDWIGRIAWSPDGSYLASGAGDKQIIVWGFLDGSPNHVLTGHTEGVSCVEWAVGRPTLASGSADRTVRIWDVVNETAQIVLTGHSGFVRALSWVGDTPLIASGSEDGSIQIWDSSTGSTIRKITGHDWILAISASPSGEWLAVGYGSGSIKLFDTADWKVQATFNGHKNWVDSIAWHPSGRLLASASGDKTIGVWEPARQKAVQILEGHSQQVRSVTFSSDGTLLASKADDGLVTIWNTEDWKQLYSFSDAIGHNYWPPAIAFNPQHPVLATFGEDNTTIRIWTVDADALRGEQSETWSTPYTTAKIALVGDSGVGKTGLGWRLAHGKFKEHASTHGQQFWAIPELGLKRADGTECEAVLWDLAGQHVYRQIHSIFLENVAAALVVFDPSNRQDPLKGVQFWVEQLKDKGQLPPTVLVGARVDRGAPLLSQQELDQFCQRYSIRGGYISTSAKNSEGLEALLERLKAQIPWEDMTATVTTVTFKRIKDYVLSLKEKPDREGVLVIPLALREQLQATDQDWRFTDAEMMTAVGHLETHGYVAVLRSSAGEQYILLTPDLLVTLASSLVLLADKNQRELGAVSEAELLQGKYPFDELVGLAPDESQILLDAAILRFLQHNICFRETLDDEGLLIFPGLIKQKRPLQDDLPSTDDISYVVRGRVETLYASLVVLLGYTPSFTRINQWQNQAQYEMGEGEICGFRLIEDREGEIELVLYYGEQMPPSGRTKFQELFEQFLYQRDVEVARFPPVVCPKGHRLERATVIKRVREGKRFVFCEECGDKTDLPNFDQLQTIGIGASPWLQREEAAARLRSTYEVHLTKVKGYRRDWAVPRCYVSHLPEQDAWAEKLIHDLRDAGVYVVEQTAQVQPDDLVMLLDTPAYQKAFNTPVLAADAPLIRGRLDKRSQLISLALTGQAGAHQFKNCKLGSFCDETHYPMSLFDLVLNLYAIPLTHAGFAPLRQALHEQWEQTLARKKGDGVNSPPTNEKPTTSYRTIQIFLASSSELKEDRDAFDLYFRQQNDQFLKKGFYLEIVRWENFLDAMSETRLQDEYNKQVRACDIFVSLFFTKTGKFTEEEFDTAHRQFTTTRKPIIYTFFKDAEVKTGSMREEDLKSLWAFKKKMGDLGHFYTGYDNTEHLKRQFRDQLDKLLCGDD